MANLSSRLYSSDGILLKSFHEERLFIPIERIPTKIIDAFFSEVKFYNHSGVDFYTFESSVTNLIVLQ